MRGLACLFVLLAAPVARADVDVRVGSGAGCATASIQTAVNAVQAADGVTNILIARNAVYSAQQIVIAGKNVRLIGGYADCSQAAPDATKTVLSGVGGSANTVVTVTGSTAEVAFRNLEVTAGDEVTTAAGKGGGFAIAGGPHAHVAFEDIFVHDNQAGFGGGVYIDNEHSSDPGDVRVVFGDNVRIDANYGAWGGGGIWCSDSIVIFIGNNSYIARNRTAGKIGATVVNGPGGGVRAENCRMWIGATSNLGTISQNSAGGNGGGLSVSGERASVLLYTLRANRAPAVLLNTAQGVGGGIDVGSSAQVVGFDLVVNDNTAGAGGGGIAVYDNDDPPDASFTMRGSLDGAPADPNDAAGAAVLCAMPLVCNSISANLAMSGGGAPQSGAALRVVADSGLANHANPGALLEGTRVTGNVGESLMRLISDTGSPFDRAALILNGTQVTGNEVSGVLLHNPSDNGDSDANGYLEVLASTIADNDIAGADVVRASGVVRLRSSIVWQPGKRVLDYLDANLSPDWVEYVLASDLAGIPASTHNLVADPRFVAPESGDYRLRLDSPAVDFAPLLAASYGSFVVSADGAPRQVDLVSVPDYFGTVDLGSFERQFACAEDTVFCSGFE